MNHSFYSADRMTHLKIVVVALVAAIGVAAAGISARVTSDDSFAQLSPIKASKTVVSVSSNQQVIR